MIYKISPCPKPRMTQSDKWKKRPAVMRYRAFCDDVRLQRISLDDSGNIVTFVVSMPQSWSKKKRFDMFGKPHQQRPDLDNYLKALMDAIFDEDSHIWEISARKIWGNEGFIEIL